MYAAPPYSEYFPDLHIKHVVTYKDYYHSMHLSSNCRGHCHKICILITFPGNSNISWMMIIIIIIIPANCIEFFLCPSDYTSYFYQRFENHWCGWQCNDKNLVLPINKISSSITDLVTVQIKFFPLGRCWCFKLLALYYYSLGHASRATLAMGVGMHNAWQAGSFFPSCK